MSTQSEREAAARAWWKSPGHDTAQALADATCTAHGYACPVDGTLGTLLGALSLWLAWAKADAAKAAPAREADALEGVVWRDPRAVIAWAEQDWSDRPTRKPNGFEAMGVSDADARVANEVRGGMGWTLAITSAIAAHARAQLAREAHEAAPAKPAALTLEQARAMCRKAGDTVVTGGYEDAPRALACLIAGEGLGEVDGHLVDKALRDEALCRSEIARLRALGVTPAVLS